MIDPQAKPGPYIKLMALVVLVGLISALVTFAFMALVHQGTGLVWEQICPGIRPGPAPIYPPGMLAGGLAGWAAGEALW